MPARKKRSAAQPHSDLAAFGKRLKEYRQARGFTQEDVAGDRYSAAYISHLESGKREPSNDALGYMAGRLGVGVEELWTGRGVNWAVEMAEALRARGLPNEAYVLLEQTLTNLERNGQVSPYVLSVMHRELGFSQMDDDPVAAEKHLREAVALALEHDGPVIETAQTLSGLGELLAEQGDLEGGVDAYRQAAELLLKFYPRKTKR